MTPSENYRLLRELAPKVMDRTYRCMRLDAEGLAPLSLRWILPDVLSIMQSRVHNGVLVREPEYTCRVDDRGKIVQPLSYDLDEGNIHQAAGEGLDLNQALRRTLNGDLLELLREVTEDGYAPAFAVQVTDGEEKEVLFERPLEDRGDGITWQDEQAPGSRAERYADKLHGICAGDMPAELQSLRQEASALRIEYYTASADIPLDITVSREMYEDSPGLGAYTTGHTDTVRKGSAFMVDKHEALIDRHTDVGSYPGEGEAVNHTVRMTHDWRKLSKEIGLAAYLDSRMRENIAMLKTRMPSMETLAYAKIGDEVRLLNRENNGVIQSFFESKGQEFNSLDEQYRAIRKAPDVYPDCPEAVKEIAELLYSEDVANFCAFETRTAEEFRRVEQELYKKAVRVQNAAVILRQSASAEVRKSTYTLYQLRNTPELREASDMNLQDLRDHGMEPAPSMYEAVYCGLRDKETLEDVEYIFSNEPPADYVGRSLSVGDILVFTDAAGRQTAQFYDSFGYEELPGFVRQLEAMPPITRRTGGLEVEGHRGTWYCIDSTVIDGKAYFLMESETIGDEAAALVVDESGNLVLDDVWNGLHDLHEHMQAERRDEIHENWNRETNDSETQEWRDELAPEEQETVDKWDENYEQGVLRVKNAMQQQEKVNRATRALQDMQTAGHTPLVLLGGENTYVSWPEEADKYLTAEQRRLLEPRIMSSEKVFPPRKSVRPEGRAFYDRARLQEIPMQEVCAMLDIPVKLTGEKLVFAVRDEKTPSCVLYPNNTFCDFGNANRGGDTINLVQYATGRDWYDAAELLAREFGILPETPVREGKHRLTARQYAKIGIQADPATANFDIDVARYGEQRTAQFVAKYQMPVQELAERYPEVYHNMLRKRAAPYLYEQRTLYYRSLQAMDSLYGELGLDILASQERPPELEESCRELMEAEKIMKQAVTDAKQLAYTPKTYDVTQDIEGIRSGKISIEVGPVYYAGLKQQTREENLLFRKIPAAEYFRDEQFRDTPHAAFFKAGEVNVAYDRQRHQRLFPGVAMKKQANQPEKDRAAQEEPPPVRGNTR